MDMASSMGYERNEPASNLRKGHSNVVGIIVPRINRAFFSSAISGAETILKENGYSVIICQTLENFDDEVKALKTLKSNRVAGVLISHSVASTTSAHILDNIGQGTILVQFDRVFNDLPGPKIVNDNFQGAYEGTYHLIEQGYQRIGHLAGSMDTAAYLERLNGYKQALTDMGRDVDEDLIFYNSIVEESGYEAGKAAVERGCDALYCAGDFSALGAYMAVKDKGLLTPKEFGLVGTANEFFTRIMTPSISSIAQHPYEIGRRAAQAFLTSLKPEANVGKIVVAMEMIVRESSSRIIKKE